MKKQALHLYLEGLGFRSIGRFLGVSNVTVLNWIGSFGLKENEFQSKTNEIEVVEIDEIHTSVKKTTVGYGLLLIDMEKDSSTSLLAIGAQKPEKIMETN
jgi:NADH/NAD ratio-sensing transcriptional regulator Rex